MPLPVKLMQYKGAGLWQFVGSYATKEAAQVSADYRTIKARRFGHATPEYRIMVDA